MALQLKAWDWGLFQNELRRQNLVPRKLSERDIKKSHGLIIPPNIPPPLSTGTFNGTAKAMTEMYRRIQDRFASFFDVANFEPAVPQALTLQEKKKLFTYQTKDDGYPPHLDVIPKAYEDSLFTIFNTMRLLDTAPLLQRIVPEEILDFVYPNAKGGTIAEIETRNHDLRKQKKNIYDEPNVGDRPDWYTDAVFAQQQLTGNNPTTIEIAAQKWIDWFTAAAKGQGNSEAIDLIREVGADSLYVQDCSYYRSAVGVGPDATMRSSGDTNRFGCASVSLFYLNDDGKLHPLAICLDYKGSIENSVVIFNKRLRPSDSTASEAADWPWRYAKTCSQSSDWVRHEASVHLTNTHLVEEAIIVASHRTLPSSHLVFRLLEPHWFRTLSLNASARTALVPHVVAQLVGIPEALTYTFIKDAYKRFDWQANYVPADLARRGFPVSQLLDLENKKFHNYAYGKTILLVWNVLRDFVSKFLNNGGAGYTTDSQVANDVYIRAWCNEIRSPTGAQLKTFPNITTLDQLTDAITMCIHIASPQHTAINYLQNYYQAFVINKPPSLCAPLPETLDELLTYGEADLIKALPVDRPREWLLASHVPYLLSFRVAEEQNLVNYATSEYFLAKSNNEAAIEAAAKKLVDDLALLGGSADGKTPGLFQKIRDRMDDQVYPYTVLDPVETAVSILI